MARGILEIDGRRIELTDAQVEELLKGKEEKKTPFTRVERSENYYCISYLGEVVKEIESDSIVERQLHGNANYCTDGELMKQRALHEILDRLLWRFSMENDGDKIDWGNEYSSKYYIYFNNKEKRFVTNNNRYNQYSVIYFYSEEIAKRAIKEIIEPIMKKHPEFVW